MTEHDAKEQKPHSTPQHQNELDTVNAQEEFLGESISDIAHAASFDQINTRSMIRLQRTIGNHAAQQIVQARQQVAPVPTSESRLSSRLPSVQRSAASGRALGQTSVVTLRAQPGRIHRSLGSKKKGATVDTDPPGIEQSEWEGSAYANCYAYAAGDKTPYHGERRGATAVPGGIRGEGATPMRDEHEYTRALIDGAIGDGMLSIELMKAMIDDRLSLASVPLRTAAAYNPPNAPPPAVPGYSLALLINHSFGFHWMRRDGDDTWSQKHGNEGLVDNYDLDPTTGKKIIITNSTIPEILINGSGRYKGAKFGGYFYVKAGGIEVGSAKPITREEVRGILDSESS